MPDPIVDGVGRTESAPVAPGPETAADPKGAAAAPGPDTTQAADGGQPVIAPEELERQKNFHDLYERKQREWSERETGYQRRIDETEERLERLMGLISDPRARNGQPSHQAPPIPEVAPDDPAYPFYMQLAAVRQQLEEVGQRLGNRDHYDQASRAQHFIDEFAAREKLTTDQRARLDRYGVAIRKGDSETLLRATAALIREEEQRAKADREAFINAAVEADRNGRRETVRAGATAAASASLGAPPVDWSEKSDREYQAHLDDVLKDSEAFLRSRGLPIPGD